MGSETTFSRREALAGSLIGSALGGIAISGTSKAQAAAQSGVLVAYFTRTENTRLIATQLASKLNATLFRIEPAVAYPEDYEQQVAQAEQERLAGFEPPLRETVASWSAYQSVFLGFPVWGMTAPSIIRSFLAQHDFSGRDLVPFITHGGYGTGSSLDVLRRYAPNARIGDAFIRECDQERATLNAVTQWLATVESQR
ncbi:hypothetical protein sos41_06470 [Alphaproteobacteria bacterium SO-S41]|nr:hypothetical protein sos41_06470 [Alphaproteobacteria bacterium SO-S41]